MERSGLGASRGLPGLSWPFWSPPVRFLAMKTDRDLGPERFPGPDHQNWMFGNIEVQMDSQMLIDDGVQAAGP